MGNNLALRKILTILINRRNNSESRLTGIQLSSIWMSRDEKIIESFTIIFIIRIRACLSEHQMVLVYILIL